MQYLRLFVKLAPDAMTTILTDDGAVIGLGMSLDVVTDVAEMSARSGMFESNQQTFMADLAYSPRRHRWLADEVH